MELTVQGRRAYAYTGGKPLDATLPCIVFLHGAMSDHSVWTLLARWFAHHGHAVLAVDQPGHGRSEGPPLESVEALAGWALALLDSAGVAQAAWVGHSMGSMIALEAAAREPARATQLVMIGTTWPMKVSDALLTTARENPKRAIDMVNALSQSSLASKPSYPGPGMWIHGSSRALMRRMQAGCVDTNLFDHDFSVCDRYLAALEAAARVTCPVTLILGERDQMTPAKGTATLATALNARTISLASGHNLMAEVPDAVLKALHTALA